jgi:hypothetical protein
MRVQVLAALSSPLFLVAACAAPTAPTSSPEDVATAGEAITSAEMAWDPNAPTASTTITPGHEGRFETPKGANGFPQQVGQLAVDTFDGIRMTSGGSIYFNARAPYSPAQTAASCGAEKIAIHVWGWVPPTKPAGDFPRPGRWIDLGGKDASGYIGGGIGCGASATIAFSQTYLTRLRIVTSAPSGWLASAYGQASILAPDPKVTISEAEFTPDRSTFYAVFQDSSTSPATDMSAYVWGTYDYCPAGKTCALSPLEISHCAGAFCPAGMGPQGVVLAQPVSCNYNGPLYLPTFDIAGKASSIQTLATAPYGDDGPNGCKPCDPKDGRCANIHANVVVDSLLADQDATWDKPTYGTFHGGVFE